MSLFARIFRKKTKPASARNPPNVVVADFGECLEKRAPVPGSVADVSELPYQKDEIKVAILLMLKAIKDRQLREHLKFAYVSLANWQAGVGAKHQGLDITKLDRSKSALELAKEVVGRHEEMEKWQPKIKAEQEALIAELQQLGYW